MTRNNDRKINTQGRIGAGMR